MNSRRGETDSQFLTADELMIEAELLGYAARVAPTPSATFVAGVLAAADPRLFAGAARSPLMKAADRLRVALAQVSGGPAISLKVRLQAGAMLVVVAMLATAGAAVAATGATTVFNWVAGPAASAPGSASSASSTLEPNGSTEASQSGDSARGSHNPGNGGKPSENPGECGQPINNPGNGNKPSVNPGQCNQPSTNPGGKPSTNPGGKPSH